jgi:hypothetical protein
MPGFPFPGRPGGAHDEPLLDMIFDRCPLPPGAPQEMHDLSRMLAAADGPGDPSELAGEAAALAAFSRFASPAGALPAVLERAVPSRRGHRGHRGGLIRGRLATALVVTVAALASAAAAYIGVLPGPLQRVAHVTVGAPAPTRHGSPAKEHRRPIRPHREAPRLGTVPTHRKADATRTSQAHPRRTRAPGALNCRPWQYQLPPGWAPPDPAWASAPRDVRCPRSGAHATPAATPASPSRQPSTSPGTQVSTSGGGSSAQQTNPSPTPSAGSSPGPRT